MFAGLWEVYAALAWQIVPIYAGLFALLVAGASFLPRPARPSRGDWAVLPITAATIGIHYLWVAAGRSAGAALALTLPFGLVLATVLALLVAVALIQPAWRWLLWGFLRSLPLAAVAGSLAMLLGGIDLGGMAAALWARFGLLVLLIGLGLDWWVRREDLGRSSWDYPMLVIVAAAGATLLWLTLATAGHAVVWLRAAATATVPVAAPINGLRLALLALTDVGLVLFALSMRWWRLGRFSAGYVRYAVLALAAAIVLMPFFWLLAAAFKDKAVLNEYMFFPPADQWFARTDQMPEGAMNLGNFRVLFEARKTLQGNVYFWQYLVNSLFLAGAGTVINLFLSSLGGYALAKYDFRGKRLVMGFMLGSMMIPGMILLAPVYELICKLGWVDTYLALLVPGAVSVFGMFLFRQAILGVPDDLIEAGRIDGCSEFGIYLRLVMPLVRPMSGAFCLVAFLGRWNSFIAPNVYIHSQHKLTLPVVLNQYVGFYSRQYGVFLAGTLLAIIPPAILFFALQREFVTGLTSGAVKG